MQVLVRKRSMCSCWILCAVLQMSSCERALLLMTGLALPSPICSSDKEVELSTLLRINWVPPCSCSSMPQSKSHKFYVAYRDAINRQTSLESLLTNGLEHRDLQFMFLTPLVRHQPIWTIKSISAQIEGWHLKPMQPSASSIDIISCRISLPWKEPRIRSRRRVWRLVMSLSGLSS